jgi:hypothetical protein
MLLAPSNAKSWASRIQRIIFDEIHCIGQSDDGVVWDKKHNLKDVWNCDQDLTASWVVDAVITCMNSPNRLSSVFVILTESCLDFGGDLVYECFSRGHMRAYNNVCLQVLTLE